MSKKSGGRQYKNVYTILEKVKKGEIDTYYDKSESLFSRLDFYKRPDLAKPYLHYLDESRLDDIIKAHFFRVRDSTFANEPWICGFPLCIHI